jgi:hypothetical protein
MDEIDKLREVELGVGDGGGMRAGSSGETLDRIHEVGNEIRQFWINEKVSLRYKKRRYNDALSSDSTTSDAIREWRYMISCSIIWWSDQRN